MNTIDEHIAKDQTEIEAAKAAGDSGKVRHLEDELKDLQEYKAHHPEDKHDPTPLEVFCDLNPEKVIEDYDLFVTTGGAQGWRPRPLDAFGHYL